MFTRNPTSARLLEALLDQQKAHRADIAALRDEMRERDARHERMVESTFARFVDVVRSSNPLLAAQQVSSGESDLPDAIREAISRRASDANERDDLMEFAVTALADVDGDDEEAVEGIARTILRGADLTTW
jgi:hypothetical protein